MAAGIPRAAVARAIPKRPLPGSRSLAVLAILASGALAAVYLRLDPRDLVPSSGALTVAGKFFAAAFSPALAYDRAVPEGTPPLLLNALEGARATVVFAAAACSLSLIAGLVLGFLASTAWWAGGVTAPAAAFTGRWFFPAIYFATRALITFMRSIHELIWAVLFLAAFGLHNLSAVIAIAIPFSGTLAKVFSELIDEAPRDAAEALRATGASSAQTFLFGLLPRALPDMSAYAFYRFECALRSSAVLGFFGYPTLGYYISAAFENLYYREVWTYLYTLFIVVLIVDRWSGALRHRMVR